MKQNQTPPTIEELSELVFLTRTLKTADNISIKKLPKPTIVAIENTKNNYRIRIRQLVKKIRPYYQSVKKSSDDSDLYSFLLLDETLSLAKKLAA